MRLLERSKRRGVIEARPKRLSCRLADAADTISRESSGELRVDWRAHVKDPPNTFSQRRAQTLQVSALRFATCLSGTAMLTQAQLTGVRRR